MSRPNRAGQDGGASPFTENRDVRRNPDRVGDDPPSSGDLDTATSPGSMVNCPLDRGGRINPHIPKRRGVMHLNP